VHRHPEIRRLGFGPDDHEGAWSKPRRSVNRKSPGRGLGSQFAVELPTVSASGRFSVARRFFDTVTPLKILLVEDHGGTLEVMAACSVSGRIGQNRRRGVKDALARRRRQEIAWSSATSPSPRLRPRRLRLKSPLQAEGIAVSGFGMDDDTPRAWRRGSPAPDQAHRSGKTAAIQQVADEKNASAPRVMLKVLRSMTQKNSSLRIRPVEDLGPVACLRRVE
jgi:hypothetical protein